MIDTSLRLELSPSLLVRADEGKLVAWSDRARSYAQVTPNVLDVIGAFAGGATLGEVIARWGIEDAAPLFDLVQRMLDLGFLVPPRRHEPVTVSDCEAPIFLVGCPRSGTTLLRWLFDAHSAIACPPESKLAPFLHEMCENPRTSVGLESLAGSARAARLHVRGFMEGLLSDYAARSGKRRWADKTPEHLECLSFLDDLFDRRARFVFLVRHPFDTATSLVEITRTLPVDDPGYIASSTASYFAHHIDPLVAMCHYWADANERILDFADAHPSRSLVIRYEDLVGDPISTTGFAFSFVGEEPEPEVVERAFASDRSAGFGDQKILSRAGIDSESVGRWRSLPGGTLGEIWETVADVAARCDYL